MSHCILFIQRTSSSSTRTYADYENINSMLDGVCKLFEDYLKSLNPSATSIAYDIWELLSFIDQLRDLSVMIFVPSLREYLPHNKQWIKNKLYILLKNAAMRNAQPIQ